jgi:hypothetical protein
MRKITNASILCVTLIFAGCAATKVSRYQAAGQSSICNGNDLGTVAVLPEAAWRPDQKEPQKREMMALAEIKDVFQSIPCGSVSQPGGVREFANWSSIPEPELLNRFASEGVDTIIIIRVEELTPNLNITFSLPFLWGGSNEADFRIRALSTKTGTVLNDMRINRVTGGAFNIRPAKWSGIELNSALSEITGKK